ncbi:MAG: hypothetical protein JKY76_01490 [Proteobacteria bacterium]|nr:hypothetical protein [Pseudomonadota bacterium]
MSIFDIFKRENDPEAEAPSEEYIEETVGDFINHDYLGKAADTGYRAKAALQGMEAFSRTKITISAACQS